jgi:hypothetical protein
VGFTKNRDTRPKSIGLALRPIATYLSIRMSRVARIAGHPAKLSSIRSVIGPIPFFVSRAVIGYQKKRARHCRVDVRPMLQWAHALPLDDLNDWIALARRSGRQSRLLLA